MVAPLALLAACAGLVCAPGAPTALAPAPTAGQEAPFAAPRVRARLLLDAAALAPGEATWGLLELRAQEGWHVYWQQPGDSGTPPELDWRLPAGLTAEPLRHPAPELYREGPLAQFVHSGTVGLPFVLRAGEDFAAPDEGDAAWTLAASASWLVSKEVCEFEMQGLEVRMGWRAPSREAVSGEAPAGEPPAPKDASIAAAVAKLPLRVAPEAWSARRSDDGAAWEFRLGALPPAAAARLPEGRRDWRAFERAVFFPSLADVVPFGAPVRGLAAGRNALTFTATAATVGAGGASPDALPAGVLSLFGAEGLALSLELPAPQHPPSEPAPGDARTAPPSRSSTL